MNEIEAIAYFEKLIKYFEDKKGEPYWSEVHNSMSRQMITVALEALREQAEREKGCEYCDPDIMDGNPIIHRHSSGYIGNGKFSQGGSCLTHFCPMCGKRLEVKHEE